MPITSKNSVRNNIHQTAADGIETGSKDMITLFENCDFWLELTGHDYDFVGIIETKTDTPLTFFFSEELCEREETDEEEYDWEDMIDENQTCLLDVYQGLKEYDGEEDEWWSEEQDVAMSLSADSYFRTRDDKTTGFLADPRERGQFLALVKNYCPEQLKNIPWA